MKKTYKDIDPWKLAGDLPEAAWDASLNILSWPFKFFVKDKFGDLAKKNPKIKIMFSLITIRYGHEELSDKELKVACNIMNSPWIAKERSETISELQKKISFNDFNTNKSIFEKFLSSLDDTHIYILRHYISTRISGVGDDHADIEREYWKFKGSFEDYKIKSETDRDDYIRIILEVHEKCHKVEKAILQNPKILEENKNEVEKLFSNLSMYLSSMYSSIISTDNLSKEFDDLTKNLFKDSDTVYKTAVDANYVSDKSAYGGPFHRLFDDSHSLGKMWGKIKDAKPDDSRIEEIIAWVNEAAKDLQTTMGLPIVSMEKETFDKMVDFLAPVGISKTDLYDLLTCNLQEVLSVAFLGITTMLPSIKKDKKKLNTLRGVMAASGVFGNPLAIIFLLITIAHSIIKGDVEQIKKDLTSKDALVGFTISAIIKYTIEFLGIKVVITILAILIALAVVVYFARHKKNKKIDVEKFKNEFVKELENLREMSKNLLDKQNIKPLPKK